MLDSASAGIRAVPAKVPAKIDPAIRIAFTMLEVVALTGLSLRSIERFVDDGRLKSVRPCGRRLIMRKDLEAFLQGGEGK